MNIILVSTILTILTKFSDGEKQKHLDELLKQEEKKKVVKRYDDLQYDPANVIETVVPVKNHRNGYNFVTVKSNIPEEPASNMQYEDDQTNEIPVGPVVQSDNTQQHDKANVQLKDLLSFIRKTNIPEDPYATSERSQILTPSDYYSTDMQQRNPLLSMDSINTRTLAVQNDGIYQSKRYQFPQQIRNQLSPYANRKLRNQLPYKFNVKKAEIPQAPTPFIKETFDEIFPNAAKGDKKSGVIREEDDPLDEMNKEISKKGQVQQYLITTIQANSKPVTDDEKSNFDSTATDTSASKKDIPTDNTQANMRNIIDKNEDPYENLKNEIKKKASNENSIQNKTFIKRTRIPPPQYLMQYTEVPLDEGNKDAEKEEAAAFVRKMSEDYMKKLNTLTKKKNEIPGITIEHNLPTDSFPLTLHTIPAMVRKDMVPETEKNYQFVQDANNENEYKKSDIPHTDSADKANNDDITNEKNDDTIGNLKINEDDSLTEQTAAEKSILPTAEELEAIKIDREMKLADELGKMKKSQIPMSTNGQTNKPADYTSYPVQLRKYPAEGILRQEIPKKQNILNYNVNKTMPLLQEVIKRFEIPQEQQPPPSDMFTTIPNNQEFEKQQEQGALPDINALMQSSLMDRIQENEHREEQIQQQEQQQERRLWQQQKEEIASRMHNEKTPDPDFVPFLGQNMEGDKQSDTENMAAMSPVESFRQFVQASQEQDNLNKKRSEIPKPGKNYEAPSKDSFPLVLRKWPPNRRSLKD